MVEFTSNIDQNKGKEEKKNRLLFLFRFALV